MKEFKKRALELIQKYIDSQKDEEATEDSNSNDNVFNLEPGVKAQISVEYYENEEDVDITPFVTIEEVEEDDCDFVTVRGTDGKLYVVDTLYLEPDRITTARYSDTDSFSDKIVKRYINMMHKDLESKDLKVVEKARNVFRDDLYADESLRMANEIYLRRAHDKYIEFNSMQFAKELESGKITYVEMLEKVDHINEIAEMVMDDINDYGVVAEYDIRRQIEKEKQAEEDRKQKQIASIKNENTKSSENALDSLFGESYSIFDKMLSDLFSTGEHKLSAKDIDEILGLNEDEKDDEASSVDGINNETGLLPFQKVVNARKKKDLPECLIDMTALAAKGKFDDIIGREEEIATVAETLARKEIRNPLLVGKPGAGKTAVVQELVKRSYNGDIPHLKDKYFYELRMNDLVAGTMYRGQLEQKLQDVMKVLEDDPNVVLFIDEIHMIVQAGSTVENKNDVANALKPYLTSDISIIGATTFDEYSSTLKNDGALARRFNTIMIEEKSKDEVVEILQTVKKRFEDYHKVELSPECIEKIVDKVATSKIDNSLIAGSICAIDTICTKMKIHDLDEDKAFDRWEDEAVLAMDRKNNGGRTGTFGFSPKKEIKNENVQEEKEVCEETNAKVENYFIEDKMKDALFIEQKDSEEECKPCDELLSLIGDLPAGTAENIINSFMKDAYGPFDLDDEEDEDLGDDDCEL